MLFQQLCEQLVQTYLEQKKSKRGNEQLLRWTEEIIIEFRKSYSLERLDIILKTIISISSQRKRYQSYILDDFLPYLQQSLFWRLWPKELPLSPTLLNQTLITQETDARNKLMHQSALKLLSFVDHLFNIKAARDSYGNNRKAHAIKILGTIWNYYDTEIGLGLCIKALNTKPENLVVDTASVLTKYHLFRQLPLIPELIPLLESQVKKTKSHYVAAQCLDLMKQTKYISVGSYHSQLEDWKKRNGYPFSN